MVKPASKSENYKQLFAFIGISLVFVLSQFFFFQGFNGGDDLHYSWLAAKFTQGSYSPFRIDDIFSGRMLLIGIQALVYKIAGVNIFTTQVVSYCAVILACYLTIFCVLRPQSSRSVLISSSLFYFNSVLYGITLGPAPDPLIMLAGIIIILLLQKATRVTSKRQLTLIGAGCGLFIFSTLLIKEVGLVFLPFAVIVGWLQFGKNRLYGVGGIITAFICGVLLIGFFYKINTGDFFFRIRQIKYSFYPNPCYYTSFFQKQMAIRLTYGVWQNFIAANFFPVLLAPLIILLRGIGIFKITKRSSIPYERQFIILLILALYFPFSFSNYQPLCFKARHFLFLLPLAVVVCTPYFEEHFDKPWISLAKHSFIALLLAICITSFLDGRYWNIIRCLLAWFVFLPLVNNKRIAGSAYLLLILTLWLSFPYRFIFYKMNWYPNLKRMSSKLTGNQFYLPDHDNVMHWKLFKQFDTSMHVYDFDLYPYNNKPYPYYDSLRFHPGWFIVNRQYNDRSNDYLRKIDSLNSMHFFDSSVSLGPINAYYFSNNRQFNFLQKVMYQEKTKNCNCEASSP